MDCRVGCGACCTSFAIVEPYDCYPNGKHAGERCSHLTAENRCGIYDDRPQSCRNFTPSPTLCGDDADEAMRLQTLLVAIAADATGGIFARMRGDA